MVAGCTGLFFLKFLVQPVELFDIILKTSVCKKQNNPF